MHGHRGWRWGGLAAAALAWAVGTARGAEGPAVDAAFPGGNIVVERIEGDDVYMHQDLRDTAGNWFHWAFRVRGAAGRTLRFHFTKGDIIGARGPAVSTDGGGTWTWTGREGVKDATFSHAFPADAGEVRFCMSIPYLEKDWKAFVGRLGTNAPVRAEVLCTTAKGREAERLRFGRLDGAPAQRVLLTARHHACESLASYALEGLIAEALGPSDEARRMRESVEFAAIPFVDKDGVEDGDQGKNRKPRDHNRDYDGESVHATVRAIRAWAPAWAGGRLRAAIDLHCPYLRGGDFNERIYMVGSDVPEIWEQQQAIGRMLEKVRQGPLPFRVADCLPYGKGWNTAQNYAAGTSFGRWVRGLPGLRLFTTFEIPYANVAGVEVNADSARAFGRDIFRALARYLATGSD